MESKSMVTLTIDGKEVTVQDGITVLEAARNNDIHIPTLCHHPDLSPYGGCRLCVVEVDEAPRLAASCVTPVRNGMSVVTSNERIIEARRAVLEFLLSEKNHFCMFCAQSGDCELQNLLYEYQIDHLTIPSLEQTFPVDTSHEDIAWDHNRCILCGRCVRACREIAGNAVLEFQGRGGKTIIGVDLAGGLGQSTCVSCGVCLEFCPTGAIFHRHRTHYAVKGKPKDWHLVESVCAECGLLCPTINYVWGNNIIKIESRTHGVEPDHGQLCRKGRFDPLKQKGDRLGEPLVRIGGGEWQVAGLMDALDRAAEGLADTARRYGEEAMWGLVSPGCSNEEINGFKTMFEACFPKGRLDSLYGRQYRNVAAAGNGKEIREAPWGEILEADLILEIGANPTNNHPIINSLVKRAIFENKANLAVIGPDNPLGIWAKTHLPVENDQLEEVLGVLLEKSGLDFGLSSPAKPPEGLNGRELDELAQRFKQARKPILIIGEGLTGLPTPEGAKRALALTAVEKEGNGQPWGLIVLRPGGNCMGIQDLGLIEPDEAGPPANQFQGGIILMSEGDSPDAELEKDLRILDFLAVISPIKGSPYAEAAKVLIPKPTRLESNGTFMSMDGARKAYKAKIIRPSGNIPPVLKTLAAIQDRIVTAPVGDVRAASPEVEPAARHNNGG